MTTVALVLVDPTRCFFSYACAVYLSCFCIHYYFVTGSVSIPVVCVVLEGGPNTLETVKNAIETGTPAIIVAVSKFSLFTATQAMNMFED